MPTDTSTERPGESAATTGMRRLMSDERLDEIIGEVAKETDGDGGDEAGAEDGTQGADAKGGTAKQDAGDAGSAEGEDAGDDAGEDGEGEGDAKSKDGKADDKGDGKDTKRAFVVRDAEGDEVLPPEGLTFEFRRGKKTVKVTPDELVRLAQSTGYNEESEQKLAEFEQEVPTLRSRLEELEGILTEQNAAIEKLLDDDEVLEKARERWRKANSPEEKMKRLEEENRRLREGGSSETLRREATEFARDTLAPKLATILKQFPTITDDELQGRFARIAARFGVPVPKAAFAKLAEAVDGELMDWAKAKHADAEDRKEKDSRKATEKVLALQKRVTRAARPVGRPGAAQDAGKKRPITGDAMKRVDAIIDNVFDDD